ncbi:MAG: hypothetical protein ABSE05_09090 [Syntrophales bacterium]|jgi:hypothetical protein
MWPFTKKAKAIASAQTSIKHEGVEKSGNKPNTPVVYCFFACAKGGGYDELGIHRLLDSDKNVCDWTKAMHDKYPDADIVMFDTNEWDAPQLNVRSLEGELPSVGVNFSVREAVKKTLLARGVQPHVIEKCFEADNQRRFHSSKSGMVVWEFKYPNVDAQGKAMITLDPKSHLSGLAQQLISQNIDERDKAVNRTRELARSGKRTGLYALEEAISYMHGGEDVEYYRLHASHESIEAPFDAAPTELESLARQKLLWKTSPKKVQMLFEVAVMMMDPLLLLDRIRLYGGDDQAMAIQLLGTHIIIQDTLAARGVK